MRTKILPWLYGFTIAVWFLSASVHYTFLPRCFSIVGSRRVASVFVFSALQTLITSILSRVTEINQSSGWTTASLRFNIVVAALSHAITIMATNFSVAYGTVSGTRLIKSLEPTIVTLVQYLAGMPLEEDTAWLTMLTWSVSLLCVTFSSEMTFVSSLAAMTSTAAIACRNVFLKRELLVTDDSAATVQSQVNMMSCAVMLIGALACVGAIGPKSSLLSLRDPLAVSIACGSFAIFQIAAVYVLTMVSPTRQASIKSVHNSMTTLWAIVLDRGKVRMHEMAPISTWSVAVMALASNCKMFETNNDARVWGKGAASETTSARAWVAAFWASGLVLIAESVKVCVDLIA